MKHKKIYAGLLISVFLFYQFTPALLATSVNDVLLPVTGVPAGTSLGIDHAPLLNLDLRRNIPEDSSFDLELNGAEWNLSSPTGTLQNLYGTSTIYESRIVDPKRVPFATRSTPSNLSRMNTSLVENFNAIEGLEPSIATSLINDGLLTAESIRTTRDLRQTNAITPIMLGGILQSSTYFWMFNPSALLVYSYDSQMHNTGNLSWRSENPSVVTVRESMDVAWGLQFTRHSAGTATIIAEAVDASGNLMEIWRFSLRTTVSPTEPVVTLVPRSQESFSGGPSLFNFRAGHDTATLDISVSNLIGGIDFVSSNPGVLAATVESNALRLTKAHNLEDNVNVELRAVTSTGVTVGSWIVKNFANQETRILQIISSSPNVQTVGTSGVRLIPDAGTFNPSMVTFVVDRGVSVGDRLNWTLQSTSPGAISVAPTSTVATANHFPALFSNVTFDSVPQFAKLTALRGSNERLIVPVHVAASDGSVFMDVSLPVVSDAFTGTTTDFVIPSTARDVLFTIAKHPIVNNMNVTWSVSEPMAASISETGTGDIVIERNQYLSASVILRVSAMAQGFGLIHEFTILLQSGGGGGNPNPNQSVSLVPIAPVTGTSPTFTIPSGTLTATFNATYHGIDRTAVTWSTDNPLAKVSTAGDAVIINIDSTPKNDTNVKLVAGGTSSSWTLVIRGSDSAGNPEVEIGIPPGSVMIRDSTTGAFILGKDSARGTLAVNARNVEKQNEIVWSTSDPNFISVSSNAIGTILTIRRVGNNGLERNVIIRGFYEGAEISNFIVRDMSGEIDLEGDPLISFHINGETSFVMEGGLITLPSSAASGRLFLSTANFKPDTSLAISSSDPNKVQTSLASNLQSVIISRVVPITTETIINISAIVNGAITTTIPVVIKPSELVGQIEPSVVVRPGEGVRPISPNWFEIDRRTRLGKFNLDLNNITIAEISAVSSHPQVIVKLVNANLTVERAEGFDSAVNSTITIISDEKQLNSFIVDFEAFTGSSLTFTAGNGISSSSTVPFSLNSNALEGQLLVQYGSINPNDVTFSINSPHAEVIRNAQGVLIRRADEHFSEDYRDVVITASTTNGVIDTVSVRLLKFIISTGDLKVEAVDNAQYKSNRWELFENGAVATLRITLSDGSSIPASASITSQLLHNSDVVTEVRRSGDLFHFYRTRANHTTLSIGGTSHLVSIQVGDTIYGVNVFVLRGATIQIPPSQGSELKVEGVTDATHDGTRWRLFRDGAVSSLRVTLSDGSSLQPNATIPSTIMNGENVVAEVRREGDILRFYRVKAHHAFLSSTNHTLVVINADTEYSIPVNLQTGNTTQNPPTVELELHELNNITLSSEGVFQLSASTGIFSAKVRNAEVASISLLTRNNSTLDSIQESVGVAYAGDTITLSRLIATSSDIHFYLEVMTTNSINAKFAMTLLAGSSIGEVVRLNVDQLENITYAAQLYTVFVNGAKSSFRVRQGNLTSLPNNTIIDTVGAPSGIQLLRTGDTLHIYRTLPVSSSLNGTIRFRTADGEYIGALAVRFSSGTTTEAPNSVSYMIEYDEQTMRFSQVRNLWELLINNSNSTWFRVVDETTKQVIPNAYISFPPLPGIEIVRHADGRHVVTRTARHTTAIDFVAQIQHDDQLADTMFSVLPGGDSLPPADIYATSISGVGVTFFEKAWVIPPSTQLINLNVSSFGNISQFNLSSDSSHITGLRNIILQDGQTTASIPLGVNAVNRNTNVTINVSYVENGIVRPANPINLLIQSQTGIGAGAQSLGGFNYEIINPVTMRITVPGGYNIVDGNQLYIPLLTTLNSSRATVSIKNISRNAGVSSGTLEFASVAGKGTKATIDTVNSFLKDSVEIAPIRITENIPGVIREGNIRLTLSNDFKYVGNVVYVSFENGLQGHIALDGTNEGRGNTITIPLKEVSLETAIGDRSIHTGSIVITGMEVQAAGRDTDFGNVNLRVSGTNITSQNLTIARYVLEGISVSVDENDLEDLPVLIPGAYPVSNIDNSIAGIPFFIEEAVPGAMLKRVSFNFPVGVDLRALEILESSNLAEFEDESIILNRNHPEADKTGLIQIDNGIIELKVPVTIDDTLPFKLKVRPYFSISPDFEGTEIYALLDNISNISTSENVEVDYDSILLAEVMQPLEVTFDSISIDNLESDVTIPRINIAETDFGNIRRQGRDGVINTFARPRFNDTTFVSEYVLLSIENFYIESVGSLSVTEGNLALSHRIEDGRIIINNNRSSTRASTIEILDIAGRFVDSYLTIPEDGFSLLLAGNPIISNFYDGTNREVIATFDVPYLQFPGLIKSSTSESESESGTDNNNNNQHVPGELIATLQLDSDIIKLANGETIIMDTVPTIVNSRTLLPVRFIAYALGVPESNITWNESIRTVLLLTSTRMVQLQLGSNHIIVFNSETGKFSSILMDTPAESIDGRTMIPLRFLAGALGIQIDWDDDTRVIQLRYPTI